MPRQAEKLYLTAAQAVVRYLENQYVMIDSERVPFVAGMWAIFGHGNVAGLGEALHQVRDSFPTYRAHNEQGMAHAAIAYAKAHNRQRIMACTTSIGPGATNMVTAAALAHVNRLPVLFLPGDVFAGRQPDPVLQQIEDFDDGTVSANDCFRPVSRYFDRIARPEQLLSALPRALLTLTDPEKCGPVTLCLCQDVQAEAFEFPAAFFEPRVWSTSARGPAQDQLANLAERLRLSERPLIVAGGGVHYARAADTLAEFAATFGVPVTETQAGKGALPWDHSQNLGAIGVTGSQAGNDAARDADLVIAIGTRLSDFTTASRTLFTVDHDHLYHINISSYDAHKHNATAITGDAGAALRSLAELLQAHAYKAQDRWTSLCQSRAEAWATVVETAMAAPDEGLPSDAQVLGALWRQLPPNATVVCAAGGLPGELHKLWRTSQTGGYHVEYGFSCMGYEIAAGVGVKLATPQREVVVVVGDGSYLMMNSEIATAVALGLALTIVVLDNRGFGCINRLQQGTGNAPFNNLLKDCSAVAQVEVDFAMHGRSLGAASRQVADIAELEQAIAQARAAGGVWVLAIDTDPAVTTDNGAVWWDVAVPQTAQREEVRKARSAYEKQREKQSDHP